MIVTVNGEGKKMKKAMLVFVLTASAMFFAAGTLFAPLVLQTGSSDSSSSSSSSSSSDSSTVDLSDKDTSQPIPLLR